MEEYQDKKNQNKVLEMNGFLSTSLNIKIAFKFMFSRLNKNEASVLYKITNLNKDGYCYFNLNSEEYAIYRNEEEILLRTGLKFKIT